MKNNDAIRKAIEQAFNDRFQPGQDSDFPKGFRAGGCRCEFSGGEWFVYADDRDGCTNRFEVIPDPEFGYDFNH